VLVGLGIADLKDDPEAVHETRALSSRVFSRQAPVSSRNGCRPS
jgi:hypothetical protein